LSAANEFTIRVILPEEGETQRVAGALEGWGQVTSFGQTIFSKRVSGEEALKTISVLNSINVEYRLSIDDGGSGLIDPSSPVRVGTKGADSVQEIRGGGVKPRSRPSRLTLFAGWSAGTLALVALVVLAANLMVGDSGSVPAAAAPVGLFEDSFSDNRYGWIANESAAIDSGSYSVRNFAGDRSVMVANERLSGRNLIAEVDVTIIRGEKERFAGLAYRIRNVENFYFFGIAIDGSIAMLKRELGFYRKLEPGGGVRRSYSSSRLKNHYHLRIVVRGMYTEFYVDGDLVTIVRDESFERGLFGFYVDKNLDVAFDDLLLTFTARESFDTAEPANLN
jgi:hypothetical protein